MNGESEGLMMGLGRVELVWEWRGGGVKVVGGWGGERHSRDMPHFRLLEKHLKITSWLVRQRERYQEQRLPVLVNSV